MLKLRLQRRGKRNYATYRVVVADQRAPIKGKFLADVGFYNPHTSEFKVEAEKVKKWLGNGAQASATVHNLLVENKVIKGEKVTSWRPKVKQEEGSDEKINDSAKEEAPVDKAEAVKEEEKPEASADKKENKEDEKEKNE